MGEFQGLKIEQMLVTPELAKEFLAKNDPTRNRTLNRAKVLKYAQYIASGHWDMTHQGIAFYEDGVLADGQHRLTAIVETGKSVPMVVAYGLKNGAHLDMGKSRTDLDQMRIRGEAGKWLKQKMIAETKILQSEFPELQIVTVDAELEYIKGHKDAFEFADMFYHPSAGRGLSGAAIYLAIALAYENEEDPDKLQQVCDILASGIIGNVLDPAVNTILVLRNRIMDRSLRSGSKKQNHDILFTTAKYIQAYCKGKTLRKCVLSSVFPYKVKDAAGSIIYTP